MTWHKTMLGQIGLLVAVMAILQPIYFVSASMRNSAPGLLAILVFQYALPITIVAWIAADAKERRQTPCFDFSFLLLLAWPVSLFGYCVFTRGWPGLGLAVALFLLVYVPALVTVVVWVGWSIVMRGS